MNKKLLSFGLSTLFICQTALALPASVKAAEKVDNTQAQQLPKTTLKKQKNKHVASKNDKSNNTALYLGGAAIPAVGVLCYLFGSKSRSSRRAPSRQIPNVPTPQSPRKQAPTRPSEPVPQAPRMPEPRHVHIIPHRLSQEVSQREVFHNYENDRDACSTPVPLRAISWWGQRCWFHSSILYYYHSNYHNAILDFPIEEARELLASGNLDALQRSALEAMISLAEIFIILNGDETNPNYCKPQVVTLNHDRENDLITKLAAFNHQNGRYPEGITLGLQEKEQEVCVPVITNLIRNVSGILPQWRVPNTDGPVGARLGNNHEHYWAEVEHNGVLFGLGRSTDLPLLIAKLGSNHNPL